MLVGVVNVGIVVVFVGMCMVSNLVDVVGSIVVVGRIVVGGTAVAVEEGIVAVGVGHTVLQPSHSDIHQPQGPYFAHT